MSSVYLTLGERKRHVPPLTSLRFYHRKAILPLWPKEKPIERKLPKWFTQSLSVCSTSPNPIRKIKQIEDHLSNLKPSNRPARKARWGFHPEARCQTPWSICRLLEGPWDTVVVRYAVCPRQAGLLHCRALPQRGLAEVSLGEPVLEDLRPVCDSVPGEGDGLAEIWGECLKCCTVLYIEIRLWTTRTTIYN